MRGSCQRAAGAPGAPLPQGEMSLSEHGAVTGHPEWGSGQGMRVGMMLPAHPCSHWEWGACQRGAEPLKSLLFPIPNSLPQAQWREARNECEMPETWIRICFPACFLRNKGVLCS